MTGLRQHLIRLVKRLYGLSPVVAGVSLSSAWFRQVGGRVYISSDVTNATTTLANVTGMSVTLLSGRNYAGRVVLRCSAAEAADGIKFDLAGGTVTATAVSFGVTSNNQGATIGTIGGTSLDTVMTFTALADTSDHWIVISFGIRVNAGGTLQVRFAKNSDAGGALDTVSAGSHMWVEDMG